MTKLLFISATMKAGGLFADSRLDLLTDRHRLALSIPSLQPIRDLRAEAARADVSGIVISTTRGLPLREQIRFARDQVAKGRRVYFYWPREEAIEVADEARLESLERHWRAIGLMCRVGGHTRWLGTMAAPQVAEVDMSAGLAGTVGALTAYRKAVLGVIAGAAPLTPKLSQVPVPGSGGAGKGLYLRTDFWVPIVAGGSYGHTCHVAHQLARTSQSFLCVLANRFDLLDELGVEQEILKLDDRSGSELNLLAANDAMYAQLRDIVSRVRPDYIYERLCLGNYLGARLSQEFGIPYIVEYNGSELTMMRSFAGSRYAHEELFLLAEEAAFVQATSISVVSDAVRDDVIKRGVNAAKVNVNPNGVAVDLYQPAAPAERQSLRARHGWTDAHRVVGFTGTFGGWHGIDVLAAALPQIAAAAPEARFLLIGDGALKPLVDKVIAEEKLGDRVVTTGRVPQAEGAVLLRACDIYVSPHSSHMVGSRFFGSPTKIFEYMAMGGGIVASDLEQIGVVLSPALAPGNLERGMPAGSARAILCEPGDVDGFVRGVLELIRHREACGALGRNARQAAVDHYSWERHVERLWRSVLGQPTPDEFQHEFEAKMRPIRSILSTGDTDKNEVQQQWNTDPCGSQYAKTTAAHTVDWYREVEAHRYGEYAPWMRETMEFSRHPGARVLEVGAGLGTDLAQWAMGGAIVTDLDLAAAHLEHAEENFRLRGLEGRFMHGDAENMPFTDGEFDVVYSNGVIHHSPQTERIVSEMFRVLRPGGRAIVMVYAENSLHYWRSLVRDIGVRAGALELWSMGEIMSRHVELGSGRPLVKVYTKAKLRRLFQQFEEVDIVQRQITPPELPRVFKPWLAPSLAGKLFGWNLVLKANKPAL